MKLRIKGSSLRLRLTQGEVQSLESAGEVAEQVHFGGGARLTYRLRTDTQSREISATYGDNVIDIRVPKETVLTRSRSPTLSPWGTESCGWSSRRTGIAWRHVPMRMSLTTSRTRKRGRARSVEEFRWSSNFPPAAGVR
jgi:hypothetical protein